MDNLIVKENERFNINGNIMYWIKEENGNAMLYMHQKETEKLSSKFTDKAVEKKDYKKLLKDEQKKGELLEAYFLAKQSKKYANEEQEMWATTVVGLKEEKKESFNDGFVFGCVTGIVISVVITIIIMIHG